MDNNMLDILKNLDAAEKGEKVDGTPSTAAAEKNAMKSLLEGLDSAQNSVKQMPGTHKMAKATDKKHPAGEYLVGGEEGEPDAGDEVVSEDPTSEIVPGAKVHVGHMVPGGSGFEGTVVKVEDGIVYFENEEGRKFKGRLKNTTLAEEKFGNKAPSKDVQNKQSFAEIFKSMDEAGAEKDSALERELFGKLQKEKELHIGDNGKADLAEQPEDEMPGIERINEEWRTELSNELKHIMTSSSSLEDALNQIREAIAVYEQ